MRTRRFENTLWERTKSLRPAVHGVVLRGLTFARSPPSLRVPDPSGLSGERRLSVLPGSLGARTREAQTAGRAEAGRAARVLAVPRPERESRPRGFRNASSDRGLIRGSASVRPACGARAGGFTRRPLRYRNHDFLWREKKKKKKQKRGFHFWCASSKTGGQISSLPSFPSPCRKTLAFWPLEFGELWRCKGLERIITIGQLLQCYFLLDFFLSFGERE